MYLKQDANVNALVKIKRLDQTAERIEEQIEWFWFISRFWESEKSRCKKIC